jgi:hypothetical protein
MQKVDYTKFGDKTAPETKDQQIDRRWWLLEKKDLPLALTTIVGHLGLYDTKRQQQYQLSTKLYGNISTIGISGLAQIKVTNSSSSLKDRVTFNVVQSLVDSIIAKMTKNKPKPLFLTSGGDYKLQQKAKKLNKFIEGLFYEQHAYKKGPVALLDACVLGDGIIHVFEEHGRLKWERVLAHELFVDFIDAFQGEPRQLHRVKNIDRQVLIECFPKQAQAIKDAPRAKAEIGFQQQNISDLVTVVESWHLPSGPDAKDGVHCICLENDVLFYEKWEKCYFPFADLKYSKKMFGFWGQGLPERVQSIQLEINRISWVIQRSMQLMASFKIWIKTGSKTAKEQITNDIAPIIESEEPPQYMVPPIVAPEMYERLDKLTQNAYEQEGLSQLSANSQKPAGLDSGKALREFNDIESDRFTTLGQAYEDFFLQLARLSIDVAKDIFTRENSYEVKVPGKKFIESIDWKEIKLEEDEYFMTMFPVSSLPNDPAGRLSTIQEYVQAGFIQPRQARRLLDFPDLDQIEGLQNAEEDYLHMVLGKIADGDGSPDDYTPPEPDDDLQLAQELALEYIAQGKTNKLEPEKLAMLRDFLAQVKVLIQKAMPTPTPQAPPQGAGAPIQPQAQPMPPPTSDMVPNVAGAA